MRKLDPKKHPKLIAFLEKTQKVLKTVAVICFSLVIVLCVFFYAKACADKNTAQFIKASADEATTVADVESGIDLTQYPSANLLPLYDIKDNLTVNGVNFSVDPQTGIVLESGTATKEIWLRVITSGTLKAGTYTLSGCPDGGWYTTYRLTIQLNTSAGKVEYSEQGKGKTFTVEEDCMYILYLFVANGYTVDNLVFKPMLNVGDVAYPFIPSLERIYNNAYTSGYNQGKEEGLDYARAGYWCDVTVGVRFKGTSNGAEVSNGVNELVFYPTVTSNGIDLTEVYTKLNTDYPNLILEDFSFTLYFSNPVVLETLQFRCIGDAAILVDDVLSIVIYDPVAEEYETRRARFAYIDGSSTVSGLQTEMISETEWDTLKFKQICSLSCTSVQRISQLKGLRFYTADSLAGVNYEAGRIAGYNAGSKESYEAGKTEGYEAGFIDGLLTGTEESYNNGYGDGYDIAYDIGYDKGRSDGFQEGFNQTKSGGFGWLISSVQAFLNVNFFGDFGIGTLVYVGLGLIMLSVFLKMFVR